MFSFTHTDTVARYQRMRGREVFYPIGWDDNGLPTERRVQNYYGVRCDPSLPYEPALSFDQHSTPSAPSLSGGRSKQQVPISRRNFIELCLRLTEEDEKAYEEAWRRLGLSVDWSTKYQTIDDVSRAISQRGFLRDGDWLVSRQRFFGVPVPVWYPLDADGDPTYDKPIIPREDQLPVDPSADTPDGYEPAQRGVPGGFAGDPDILDTWATSSLTPQIAGRWGFDDDLFGRVFPMDLRPQAHEIIRTWLFSTILRSHYEFGALPWHTAAISGWILDPERKKMSKSKGNVVTPTDLLAEYGSDAVRYWAASARPGTDTAYDTGQMKIGRRLAIKLLNASKFVLTVFPATGGEPGPDAIVTEPLDRAMLAELAETVQAATDWFEAYDHARALERTEEFFWNFCDNYLELVKERAYGEDPGRDPGGTASARAALRLALSAIVRLIAPFLPFVTEEVWSWWQEGSVHRAAWPDPAELGSAADADREVLAVASDVIATVRKAKSEAKLSMRTEVAAVTIAAPAPTLDRATLAEGDLRAAGRISKITHSAIDDPHLRVTVTL